MGFSTPSTGISRRSLPAHPRCARFCRWFSTPSTGISRRSLPAHQPVLAGCPRHTTFRTCFPQGHVGRGVQHPLHRHKPAEPPRSPACLSGVPTSYHLPDVLPTRSRGSRGLKSRLNQHQSGKPSLNLLMGLPVSRNGHSPMICTMISLCRGLLSNSASTICCHVPRSRFDLSKGTVSEGPMKEALT